MSDPDERQIDAAMAEAAAPAGPGPATKARRHEAAIKAWNKRGRKKDRPPVPAVSRGDWNSNNTEAQRQLMSSPVVEAKPLGGGISETYVVKLASGQQANFKVTDTAEREVATWELAQLVGMEDMVPPAVVREIDVPGGGRWKARKARGSMALWQEGDVAGRLGGDRAYDGREDLQRAAIFDFIAGNVDRHNGNWVVDRESGKIKLIDHNLTFSTTYVASAFIGRIEDKGMGDLSPAKFAAPYLAKKSQIATKLKATGLTEDQVTAVLRRIDMAGSAKTWEELISAKNEL